jgi:capsular polysaccharide biosynthesis protein
MTAAALNQLNTHEGVLVEKPSGVVPIRADAANQSGRVNNQVGMKFAKQLFDIILAREVEIFTAGRRDPAASDLPQPLHNVGAKEAGAPGNQDALGFQIMFHVLPSG